MAQAPAPCGAERDAHAVYAPSQERGRTVAALVSATPSVSALRLSTLSTSERRISIPFRHGIEHTGGRPRRLLTGLLTCGRCGTELRASSRSRPVIRYGPLPLKARIITERQATYECSDLRHISILAIETEQRVSELVERRTGRKADRAGIASAVLRIVVSPGRPGLARFDNYRLRIVWRDPAIRTTPLRRLYDQAGP